MPPTAHALEHRRLRVARTTARRALSRLQPGRRDRRSREPRAPLHGARRPRGRRLLRRGARVRARRERERVDRDGVRADGAVARGLRQERSSRGSTARRSRRSCTAGRAAPTSSRCSGCCGRCSSPRDRSKAFSPRATIPSAPDIGPALDSFSERALALDLRRAYGRVPQRPGVCYFFPRPVARQRLQAAEPVPALDGAARRRRSRRVDARRAVAAGRAARHARDPAGPVPAADALPLRRVAHGRRHHGVAAGHRSRRSRPVRLLDLPRRHDGELRLRDEAGGHAVPAARLLPAAGGR